MSASCGWLTIDREIYKDTAKLVEVQQPMFEQAEQNAAKSAQVTKHAVAHLEAVRISSSCHCTVQMLTSALGSEVPGQGPWQAVHDRRVPPGHGARGGPHHCPLRGSAVEMHKPLRPRHKAKRTLSINEHNLSAMLPASKRHLLADEALEKVQRVAVRVELKEVALAADSLQEATFSQATNVHFLLTSIHRLH